MLSLRSPFGLSAAALLAAAAVWGADWSGKPFSSWNDSTVRKVLTGSPWAKGRTVDLEWYERERRPITYKDIPGADHSPVKTIGSPVGGIGARKPKMPDRADVLLRWASALPVRQATAVYRQREEGREPADLAGLVGAEREHYILEFFNLPVLLAHQGPEVVEAKVRESAFLRTSKTGRVLRPVKVTSAILGATMTVQVHFSRSQPIEVSDGDLECFADFQVFHVKEKFPLGAMVYQGRLEL